jgi:hypothetical protein
MSGALPLYEYANSAPSAWNTESLVTEFHGHAILGAAHAAAGDGEYALTARLDDGDIGLYVQNASGSTSFHDLTAMSRAPRAATDPNVFLDPWGNVDVIYVSTSDHLTLISTNAARSVRHANLATQFAPSGYGVIDVSAHSGSLVAPGLPSVSVSGDYGVIFTRTTAGDALATSLQWHQESVAPQVGVAADVTAATHSPSIVNDPVSIVGTTNVFAATTSGGHVELFTQNVAGLSPWLVSDVTDLAASPLAEGQIEIASNGLVIYLAGLGTSGHVQLYSVAVSTLASLTSKVTARLSHHVNAPAPTWTFSDLTAVITGSPLWSGNIFLSATPNEIDVAGRAASWGDLYDYSTSLTTPPTSTTTTTTATTTTTTRKTTTSVTTTTTVPTTTIPMH